MKTLQLKTKITTIALILALTMSVFAVVFPAVNAQSVTQTTYPFIGAVPNPVGVNQAVLLHVGIFQQLQTAQMGWEDLSVSIIKPDGSTDTLSGIKTDSTGGTGRVFTPTQVGTYKVQLNFPSQEITATKRTPYQSIGTTMLASQSEVLDIIVTAEATPYHPGTSLPSEYWTRPIDAQLREWSNVGGNWLVAGLTSPQIITGNAEAPESAHILWTKPISIGGVAGGTEDYEWAFSHGDAYEGKWTNRLIINGILIYCHRTNDRPLIYNAVDLRTGEELWSKVIGDNRTILMGQNLVWEGYNHHAVYPYFWVTQGSTWRAYDPYTADWEFTIENVPGGTTLVDEKGWIYRVSLSTFSGTGYVWSMVDLIEPFGIDSPAPGSWLPAGSFYGTRHSTYDAAATTDGENLTAAAQRAYTAEFTFDASKIFGGIGGFGGSDRAWAFGDKIFGLQYSTTAVNTWAVSLEPGNEGTILFSKTWAAPASWEAGKIQIEFNAVNLEEGVAAIWNKDTLEYFAFSTNTGDYLWGPAEPEYYMNYYGWTEFGERPILIDNGRLYSSGAGGIVYCYNLTNGDVLWTYVSEDPYQEYLFANNWWQFFLFIVDGKLYSSHMEHSAIEPMPRGAPFICLDAETGDVIWETQGLFRSTRWGGRAIIGDSIIAMIDSYDNRLYAIGKGPSAIDATASPKVSALGSSVIVEGKVTDVSPGTQTSTMKLRFPNGVPAISDASMSDWMMYVYKNFERPADAYGVTVKIEGYDPNGNYQNFGTTTSDSNGNFALVFEPEVPGTYWISATFEGSNGYYGSTASTYLTVDPAPEPYPTVTIPPYPGYQGPSASDVAQNVLADLPENPTSAEIAQAVENQLTIPESTVIPEYTTMDLVILAAVAVAIVISLVSLLRKRQ